MESDWSDVSTSQGIPKIVGNQLQLGEMHGADLPLEPLEIKQHLGFRLLSLEL